MKPPEKKSMIVAIGVGKPKAEGDEDAAPESSEDPGATAAFDAFASAAGIPEEKKAAAMSALKAFISCCGGTDED